MRPRQRFVWEGKVIITTSNFPNLQEQERLRRVYQQYNGNGAENNNYAGNGGENPSAGYDKLEPVCAVPAMTNLREELALSRMGDDVQEMPFDSVLSKYLDRDYWERKRRETEACPCNILIRKTL